MKEFKKLRIGEIVADDFRAAEVFKKAGIDFCCGGNQSLEEVAKEKDLNIAELENKLNNLETVVQGSQPNYKDWNLDFLCDYIVNEYHSKVYRVLPQIMDYLNKIVQVHGAGHPELKDIADLFSLVNTELPIHQQQEENVFFPAIKEALSSNSAKAKEIVNSQITLMMEEHELIGGTVDKISALSNHYSVPDDGCNTYHVTYKLLEEFEEDLHVHVHLENNILYPKALNLTKS